MDGFKPKSIEELNAVFEQKLAEYNEQREKEFAQDDILSEEQKEFYKIDDTKTPKEQEETEVLTENETEEPQEDVNEVYEEEQTIEVVEEVPEEENEEETAEKIEETAEEVEKEVQAPQEEAENEKEDEKSANSEEPEEVNELLEAERLAQQEAKLYEENSLNANKDDETQSEENEKEEKLPKEEESSEKEQKVENQSAPVFYFKENAEDLNAQGSENQKQTPEQNHTEPMPKKEFEEVKLTRTKDIKAEKKQNKKNKNREDKKVKVKNTKNHKTAKTVLNTLISVVIIVCAFINGVVFMADMPKRFIANTGLTVCEHTIEGSNVKSGSLLVTKKADTAEDNKIVAALTKDKKVVLDFKQNIPDGAQTYSKVVKLIPKAGGAIKLIRNYWFESGLVELAVLLVLLIARVAVSDKKEKPETKKKDK